MFDLNVNQDQSENIYYNYPDFPIMAKIGDLYRYPNMVSASHWHNDFEFVLSLEGSVGYRVNGREYELAPGHGLFINSRQLHSVYSTNGTDGKYLCVLISPKILCQAVRIHSTYLEPIYNDAEHPVVLLSPSSVWQNRILTYMRDIYQEFQREEEGCELRVISMAHLVILTIFQNRNNATIMDPTLDRRTIALHKMIGYIQSNYQTKITLNDIATAGNVCRSTCCEIFQSLLHTTPIIYLSNYRIEKSIECLTYSNSSITEIAFACGFSGSSYYTELFHREMGVTPTEYRNRLK